MESAAADGTSAVHFTVGLEISPFELFRGLKEGRPFDLVDVRPRPGAQSFAGARLYAGAGSELPAEVETVLFDDDGLHARALARELRSQGGRRVRALFGGLTLYDFALDPAVVGEERFLVP